MNKRHVTYTQLEMLWEILNDNKDIALGYNKTMEARERSRRMWVSVAQTLNPIDGAVKNWKGWNAYWIDFKGKLKRRRAAVTKMQLEGATNVSELSFIENKFLSLIDEDGESNVTNIKLDIDEGPVSSVPAHRKRRKNLFTEEAALRTLAGSSQTRAKTARHNGQTLNGILNVLTGILGVLERIERRLPVEVMIKEEPLS